MDASFVFWFDLVLNSLLLSVRSVRYLEALVVLAFVSLRNYVGHYHRFVKKGFKLNTCTNFQIPEERFFCESESITWFQMGSV